MGKYDDFKIDDEVLVWDNDAKEHIKKRHFAGLDVDGMPIAWTNGGTSWSIDARYCLVSRWDNCEKAE